jgi:hypothetical protein
MRKGPVTAFGSSSGGVSKTSVSTRPGEGPCGGPLRRNRSGCAIASLGAPDRPARQAICARIQGVVFTEVPFVPLGMHLAVTACRNDPRDRLGGRQ